MRASRRRRRGGASRPSSLAGALALALGAGCASVPQARRPDGPAPVWPSPPEAPLARLAGSWPDPEAVVEPGPWYGRVFDFLVGVDPEEAESGPLLARPFGVAARGETLYVADPDTHRVLKVDRKRVGSDPVVCEDLPWVAPMALAVEADGSLLVADGGAGRVVRVASSGHCTTLGVGALARPSGLALVGPRLFVVDPPAHAVVELSRDGKELSRFGSRGDGEGQLNFPTGIAARSDGTLLVVDSLHFRITRFTADGRALGSFGAPGDGSGAFGRPKAVAVDGLDRVFVSDSQHDVVIAFAPDGSFLCAIGGSGDAPGGLSLPAGLAIDGQMLHVADSFGHRVQSFELLGGGS